MKRFVDIRGYGTCNRFAFWDTIGNHFENFESEMAWETWDGFALVCPENEQGRYRSLCSEWVFDPYTEEDEKAEDEVFLWKRTMSTLKGHR